MRFEMMAIMFDHLLWNNIILLILSEMHFVFR